MYLNADFSQLESYAEDNGLSNEEVAVMIVESAMNLDDSELDNVDITITEVREGSVIIDYSLESNVANLVSSAMSNIDDMLGETITIGDDFELALDSNTETETADAAGIQSTVNTNQMNTSSEESGLGTAVEIALGVALCTVCCFLVIVLVYIKRKK